MTNEEAKMFLDNLKRCIDEHPIVADWLVEIADRKDEPTTQTETQNSNLTFKTLEYCDICDHKGCEECIANALDEHCMPSQFKKQIEDECAKEYEELGLKELKELIEADRKTEPTISKMEQVDEPKTQMKTQNSNLSCEKADEPQTERSSDDFQNDISASHNLWTVEDSDEQPLKGSERLLKGYSVKSPQKSRDSHEIAKDEPSNSEKIAEAIVHNLNGLTDCAWK